MKGYKKLKQEALNKVIQEHKVQSNIINFFVALKYQTAIDMDSITWKSWTSTDGQKTPFTRI